MQKWDLEVEDMIGNGLIKRIGSFKGEVSLKDRIDEIDTILKIIG
jgi:hypothetical protein